MADAFVRLAGPPVPRGVHWVFRYRACSRTRREVEVDVEGGDTVRAKGLVHGHGHGAWAYVHVNAQVHVHVRRQ